MAGFFEEDLHNPRGYVVKPGRPTAFQGAVALTGEGACVFGHSLANATCKKFGWMRYDDEVERQRRLLADTALAQLIIDNPTFAQPAVDAVSRGIYAYWQGLSPRLTAPASFKEIVDKNQKYVYGPTSFGRLTGALPTAPELTRFKAVIDGWVQLLQVTPAYLPQVMSLQDMFVRIYKEHGPADGVAKAISAEYRDMEANATQLRRAWYDDPNLRGREAGKSAAAVSEWPGLLSGDFTIPLGDALDRSGVDLAAMNVEQRKRGVDMFVIKASTLEPAFRKVLADNNLPFSASASGTTSTLLTSAKTFGAGAMGGTEALQQYLMGCVAYLVGGGMHTCHEVFVTGQLAGLPYRAGKYLEMLPDTFKRSTLFSKWETEFWEIVRPDRAAVR